MEQLELEVTKREIIGKHVKTLRRSGKTPASLYGRNVDSTKLEVDTKTLQKILGKAGGTDLITLKIKDAKAPVKVLVREIQRNVLTSELLHVDFYQVDMSHKIKANVPLVFTGEAPVLKKKNVSLIHLLDNLHIEALPDHIPHQIEVDLTQLVDLEHSIEVKDVPVSKDVTVLNELDQAVVKAIEAKKEMEVPVAVKAEEEGAEGAEAAAEGAEGAAEAKKEEK